MRTLIVLLALALLVLLTVTSIEAALSSDVRRSFVVETNQVRSNLALGKQRNRNSTRLPTGKNIYQLTYNASLEAEAANWVNDCIYQYPTIPRVAGNAIKISGIQTIDKNLVNTIIKSWLSPVLTYGMQSVRLTARDNSTIRSYIRMVWHNTREIGCAIKQCSDLNSTLAVCLYSPATVKVGAYVYAKAPYCKANGDCNTYSNSTCNVTTGLCYAAPSAMSTLIFKPSTSFASSSTSKWTNATMPQTSTSRITSMTTRPTSLGSTRPTSATVSVSSSTVKPTSSSPTSTRLTMPNSSSQTPSTTRATSVSTSSRPTSTSSRPSSVSISSSGSTQTTRPTSTSMKPTSSIASTTPASGTGMPDSRRLIALNAHNTLRSTVATGNAVNKNGTKLPSATNIYQLTYSKLVESYAITKAQSCQWNHTYFNGTSNNLYVFASTGGYANSDVALNSSVYSWYEELKNDGQSSLTLDSSNYNHFTEVIWKSVKEIGCAVANCPTMAGLNYGANYKYTFVVCDYSSSGNILGQSIYEAGLPCSKCPSGSTCNSTTKLCQINGVAQIHD